MKNEIYNMDCMEFMKDIPDNYYELAIVDPPYGIHDKITNHNKTKINEGNKFALRYDKKEWDKNRPDKTYWFELFRISKNQIVCGANYFCNFLPISRGWIIWDKMGNGMSSVNNELLWTSLDISIKTFQRCHGLDKGFLNDHEVFHPTTKPVALYKWLLKNYAKPNDKIFDSHVGSGSSRIAAYELGFNFEGCELDKDYHEAQELRFFEFKKKFHNEFYIPEDQNLLLKDLV
jgi:site-specific DNA-methyltransferase (adenine-specific)